MNMPPVPPELMAQMLQDADREAAAISKATESAEKDPTLVDLALELKELTDRRKMLEAEVQAIIDRQEQLRNDLIPAEMRRLKILRGNKGTFNFSGGRVQLETRLYASVDKEQEGVFKAWLTSEGEDGLYKETVNAQTLAAWLRDRRAEQLPDPPGVKVWEQTQAKLVLVKDR